ncbi:MAG: biopolymer transporter ExbD [Treponema sp.]|nr:biopolymer transporter ExbD [Treponema sp.]
MNIGRSRRGRSKPQVPLFSTSDIAFLLLIFIMLVSLINYRQRVPIEYALGPQALRVSQDANLEIWVDRGGALYLEGRPADLEEVRAGILRAYREAPHTRVHLIADRNTPFGEVHRVLDLLQVLSFPLVSLVAAPQ